MVGFILIPKNSNLQEYSDLALNSIQNVNPERIIEVRGEDIPSWISEFQRKGKSALGLTGEDLYKEFCLREPEIATKIKVLKRIRWQDEEALFNKPTLSLIGPQGNSLRELEGNLTVCISSKYKKLAKKYLNLLESKRGLVFQKRYVNGSTERSCSEGLTDLVIDIVYTGSTIKKFGLKVYDKIMGSDFLILGGEEETQKRGVCND